MRDYYAKDNPDDAERPRLVLFAEIFDPRSRALLSAAGLAPGWRCCEVGAGLGSMARWMAEEVGARGHVVAVDIDTRFLTLLASARIGVHGLDIRRAALPDGPFDLVFARLVLLHLPDPGAALAAMVAALKPGGRVAVIDVDNCVFAAADPTHPKAAAFDAVLAKVERFNVARGIIDPRLGRKLPGLFEQAGLEDITCDAWAKVVRGGGRFAALMRHTMAVRGPNNPFDAGWLTAGEQATRLDAMADPSFRFVTWLVHEATGRKPA